MKLCRKCNKQIQRGPKANNVLYCLECRAEVYKYKEYRSAYQRERAEKRAEQAQPGKIPCLICKRYYVKPIAHAWQKHGLYEREYKQYAGLDHKKGVIPAEHKELLAQHVKRNFKKVVAQNLLKKGIATRFSPGHTFNYKRSPQTLARLKKQK